MSCLCTSCGKKYKVDLNIPDNLWYDISAFRQNPGLLCGSCIMYFIEKISNYDVCFLVYRTEAKEMAEDLLA